MTALFVALAVLSQADPSPALVNPVLTSTPAIEYPTDAPPIEQTVSVQVELTVSVTGTVAEAKVIASGGPAFDRATLSGVRRFAFRPATENGVPVPVVIAYTQRFEPPPKEQPPPVATIEGELVAKGIRGPVSFATVLVVTSTETQILVSDERGYFKATIAPGATEVVIRKPGFRPFRAVERLEANQALRVRYLVAPERLNPYDVLILADRDRTEISKTVLRGDELTTVPGTFGDPFRAIATLPGVVPIVSLLPFPVVRGSSPGNTGFLMDGVRVSHLFHLLAGPSVVHPNFIDEIEFFPGAFSADFGGYSGGIINAVSTEPSLDERTRYETNFNLLESGLYIGNLDLGSDVRASLAGRYGYPGLLLSAIAEDISLTYFDYQAKLEFGPRKNRWSVFAFGARDDLESDDDTSTILSFHRVDLRHVWLGDTIEAKNQVSVVYDETLLDSVGVEGVSVIPRLRLAWKPEQEIILRFGLDGQFRRSTVEISDEPVGDDVDDDGLFDTAGDPTPGSFFGGGALVEALWRPTPRILIRPGVRADVANDEDATVFGVDPRLLWRYAFGANPDEPTFALKGGVGIYQQPPRLPVPIPGVSEIALDQGLVRSIQTTVGFEARVEGLFLRRQGLLQPSGSSLARPVGQRSVSG